MRLIFLHRRQLCLGTQRATGTQGEPERNLHPVSAGDCLLVSRHRSGAGSRSGCFGLLVLNGSSGASLLSVVVVAVGVVVIVFVDLILSVEVAFGSLVTFLAAVETEVVVNTMLANVGLETTVDENVAEILLSVLAGVLRNVGRA